MDSYNCIKRYKVPSILLLILLVACGIVNIVIFYLTSSEDSGKPSYKSIGKEAVNLMYNYSSVGELATQDKELKNFCYSKKVYKQISPTASAKSLDLYVALGNSCNIHIYESLQTKSGGYVIFTFDTPRITYGRKFIFKYELKDGLLNNVTESELIDLY